MTPLISSIRYQGVMDNRTKLLPYKSNRCQLVLSLIRQSESHLLALYVKNLAIETNVIPIVVEIKGIEPPTFRMQTERSPS